MSKSSPTKLRYIAGCIWSLIGGQEVEIGETRTIHNVSLLRQVQGADDKTKSVKRSFFIGPNGNLGFRGGVPKFLPREVLQQLTANTDPKIIEAVKQHAKKILGQ